MEEALMDERYNELGKEVAISEIEGELKKLWEADEASTNASLMNFLVYTETPQNLLTNSTAIQNLTREHACRAVLIAMNRVSEKTSIKAWITAHCHLAHGRKTICSEQLAFLLEGQAIGRLRNTVFAHLNSDLPLVFWWQGELSDLFEERLFRLLDRFVFDSSTWGDPSKGINRVLEARAITGNNMVTQDLAWTRTYQIRMAVARLFDEPLALRELSNTQKISIHSNPLHKTSAYLLAAWIVQRTGWKAQKSSKGHLVLNCENDRQINLEFYWDDGAETITNLTMQGDRYKLAIDRCETGQQLTHFLSVSEFEITRSGPADSVFPEVLVADQLSRGGKNSLFLEVLPVFSQLISQDK